MTTQNSIATVTQRIILSAAFDPANPIATRNIPSPLSPESEFTTRTVTDDYALQVTKSSEAATHHWQDTVADGLMSNAGHTGPNLGNADYGEITTSTTPGNEFELDVESLTHTFQTQSTPMPMPGVARVQGDTGHNTNPMGALTIDLGMMREIISVHGVLIDRDTHPSSSSGHHIRKQNLLDIARSQWAKVHNFNRDTTSSWQNPNRVPALTIGPMHGRDTGPSFGSNRDHGYYGDEPSDDPRGLETSAFLSGNYLIGHPGGSYGWDWTFNYKGRRRYRGLIRRLTLTQVAGQPDIWRYTFDFEIIKNEMQLRVATSEA